MAERNTLNLGSKGVVNIAYPQLLRPKVEVAMESWKQFCTLPRAVRNLFPYHPGNGMGVGYEIKETPGSTLDLKEDFHLTLAARDWLIRQAYLCEDSIILRFVLDAEALIDAMRREVEAFAMMVETELGLPGFTSDVVTNAGNWYIRFLHYFGDRNVGDEIATAHADKSAFTLHLYESHPGLQRLTHEGDWVDMPVSEGETAIIPGMRLQYRSKNYIKATYHRVVATADSANEGRFSAVCFVHPANTPVYDKERAGRLQEFSPGFNYDMPWEKFQKLFRPE